MSYLYRTHTCGDLRPEDAGKSVRLSGWVHRKRDHGQLLFVDLRDHYGITQCVIDSDNPYFKEIEDVKLESVVTISGKVIKRTEDTINPHTKTGHIEVVLTELIIQSKADLLPLQVNSNAEFPEETRHRYKVQIHYIQYHIDKR